jgi:3-oxoacyl-[acyl-carrier protein] reductase
MKLGLVGKVVMVTGSSSGIGKATAKRFGMEGAKVAVTYANHPEAAKEVASTIEGYGTETLVVKYDLHEDETMVEAVDKIVSRWGTLDVLVNNAVHWTPGLMQLAFEDGPVDDWRKGIRANLEGYYLTVQQVLPHMRKTKWGRIVMISSELAEEGMPGGGAYTAAKAGLHGLTATLSRELAPNGILSNVVMPGWTMTEKALNTFPKEMIEEERTKVPTRRHTIPSDVADLVAFLGSEANGNINGEFIRVTGGK